MRRFSVSFVQVCVVGAHVRAKHKYSVEGAENGERSMRGGVQERRGYVSTQKMRHRTQDQGSILIAHACLRVRVCVCTWQDLVRTAGAGI